LKHGNLDKF
jgi:hypothetical protein